jgi:hypothetical protein
MLVIGLDVVMNRGVFKSCLSPTFITIVLR